jgi:kynureninase
VTLEEARALDAVDPLRSARERFTLPDGAIYLDGNSLGAMPQATSARLAEVVERQWGDDLITSWNKHGWIDWPTRMAAKLAPIVGAAPDELLIADSTSVCLFKLLGAALAERPDRKVVLVEEGSFPTDLYVAQGLADVMPGIEVRAVATDRIASSIGRDTAVLLLTHIDYRSGARHDMAALNAAAHEASALTVWDLSHSAGAIEVDLNGTGCDLAVGCGYKYLNGGPGAPAFLFVAERLQNELRSPISGWMGHADPFAFAGTYEPVRGIRRFLTGTPSVLALAALECGLDTFADLSLGAIEAKAEALTTTFIEAVEDRSGDEVVLASPRDPAARGSHVCFAHSQGYAVMQALIARGVIGDFRPPDLMRFGFAPLYNSFEDAWRAAETLGTILETREWDQRRFLERQAVT